MSAYDNALAAMQKKTRTPESTLTPSTPQAQQYEYAKNQYRKAEKQLLLEAKTLAQVAAKSFEEAQALKDGQNKEKYLETLARASQERARVDHLLVAANEMKEKAEQSSLTDSL